MDSNFSEASSLAAIDRRIGDDNQNLSPAQYEIVRQVIYRTADFEYASLLKFSEGVLSNGAASLKASIPIVVDVPEIQVSIVPRLQQTFHNPVYCCATTSGKIQRDKGKLVSGLETLAQEHPSGIFIIGQSETALTILMKLIESNGTR
jgi:precorrin-8X/cobalt-precorrin-8 methylmutase